jgi:GT2 family glycosyltransferase
MLQTLNNVSLLIVTWDGDTLLKNCLKSILDIYTTLPETVVVDNASLESTKNLVESFPNTTYLPLAENKGFAGGNNAGLNFCTKDYILLLNNDTIAHSDFISPLVKFLQEHERVGIAQGTMNIPALNNCLDDCGVLMTPFGIQCHLNRGKPTATTILKPRKVFSVKGAMMMFKRAVLEDVGFLFYDHFWSYYEETDFCHRAKNAGWEAYFVPTPPIDHLCGATSTRFDNKTIWRRYFRNIIYSFWKNYGLFGRTFTLPIFICAAFIRSPSALCAAMKDIIEMRF